MKKQLICLLFLCSFLLWQTNVNFASEIEKYDIPSDIASVNSVCEYQGDKLVYYIHDAHCQPEAQYTIAKLIERIISHHGNAVIALEGAQGKFKADMFRKFPDKKALLDVSGEFVENGSISGVEYLFLNSTNDLCLVGAENRDYYIENYNCMINLLKIQNTALRSIDSLINESIYFAENFLNDKQKEFIKNWSAYKKGEIELKSFAEYLSGLYIRSGEEISKFNEIEKYLNACTLEKNLKIETVESERLAFFDWFTARADKDKLAGLFTADLNYQLKKITPKEYFLHIIDLAEKNDYDCSLLKETKNYNNYLNIVSSLDSMSFHSQLNECVGQVKDILFTSEKESDFAEYVFVLHELNNLVGLHITNADFDSISKFKNINDIKSFALKIFQHHLNENVKWNTLEQAYNLGIDFYSTARKRDSLMVSNLLAEMESQNCPVGVIVAGGFHHQGICGNLNKNKINYVSVKPSLIEVKDKNRYVALIRNIKTPLERWASDSTLAVASWLSENPLVNGGAKQVKTVVFSSMLISASISNMLPNELVLLRENLSDFIDRAQLYLDVWMKQYAPQIELKNILLIDNRFAVEILVNGREIVFLFETFDSQDESLPIGDSKILEKTQFGDDPVTIVTQEVAEQLRKLALIEQEMNSADEEQQNLEKLFKRFGLVNSYKSNELTLTRFTRAVNDLSRSGVQISLKDYYTALKWLIKNQLDLFTPNDLAIIVNRNEQLHDRFDLSLKPSDLNALAYQLLKDVSSGDGILSVSDFPEAWQQIFSAKGIDSIVFQPGVPYEAVVRVLFDIVFMPPMEPDVVNLGEVNGQEYHARYIKLNDGGMMVRVTPAAEPVVKEKLSFEQPFDPDDGISPETGALKEGILLIEVDGGFVLSNMLDFNAQTGEFAYTNIKNNSVRLKRGKSAESFFQNFIKNMMKLSMERGYVPRGIIYRNQGGEPQYFPDEEYFIEFMKDEFSSAYLPIKQGEWTDSVGRLTEAQMMNLLKRGIILGDFGGGYENFQQIEKMIDLKGKTVLDLGSQLGYNVFYAHLKGAEFAVGVDINPYQQRAAREVSAYLHDEMQQQAERIEQPIPSLVVSPGGTTDGQLFFRLLDLKEYEEKQGLSLASKPPENIELSIADSRNLPYEDDSFDVVMSQYMLPYIKNPSVALAEMLRVVKPGGIVQYNFSFTNRVDHELLEEACAILARTHNIHVTYTISGLDERVMVLQVTYKHKIEDVTDAERSGLSFTNQLSNLPNNFDSKPYLESLYPPVTAMPADYNILATGPLNSLTSISGIKGQKKAALAFTKQMLDKLYSRNIYGDISTVQISRGSSQLVSIIDDTLIIDEAALNNAYILFSLVEQTLVSRLINNMPDEFFSKYEVPSELIPLYKEVVFLQYFPQQIMNRFPEDQVRQIVAALKGAAEKDTLLEFQADLLGLILELSLTRTMSTKKLIYEVLKKTLDLPQYKHLKESAHDLGTLFDDGVVSLLAIETVENLSWQLGKIFRGAYPKTEFDFGLLSPELIAQARDSVNPDLSIKEYIAFLPYQKNIREFGTNIPSNLEGLLADETFTQIFQNYPAVGFYVLKDMIKAVVNDPSDPPQALFLSELDTASIMAVIQNITRSMDETLPEFENGVEQAIPILQAMPATAWIGPRLHAKLVEMNNGQPYRVLNMELDSSDEHAFLKKLDSAILLNDIQDDEFVALKITRKTTSDSGDALDVYIAVDTLSEIQANSELIAGFGTFMQHEMSYKKTFSMPANATKESYISFSLDLRSGGIGSEFMRNEVALFQKAGMVNSAVNISSKEVRVFSMLKREINAEVLMDLFLDRMVSEPRQIQELAALLFRIGVMDSASLDSLWDLATSEEDVRDEVKTLFLRAIDEACGDNETFLQMFNRKSMEFVRSKARLNEIKDIYSRLADDPFIVVNYPEIREEYEAFKTYENLALEAPAYNMEPFTLGLEQNLIEKISEFEDNLLGYVQGDILSNVIISDNLFVPSNDIGETYDEFASYIGRILPFIDILGTIPADIIADNKQVHINLMFRTAANLSSLRNPQEISELLQSDNVWGSLVNDTISVNKGSILKQAVQSMFYALLREEALSVTTLAPYFKFFQLRNLFPGELLENSGQWALNVIKTNPRGGSVLFLSLANLFVEKPSESLSLFTRLMSLEGIDFASLVQYAATVDSKTLINQLPDLLILSESGLRDRIQSLNGIGGESFGRLNLLFANNTMISPDVLDPSKFAIEIRDRQAYENGIFADGFSSLELAGTLSQWLSSQGVEAEIMKGVSRVSGEEQFFLRIGTVDVGISPFAEFINPDYENVSAVDQTEFKEAYEDGKYFVSFNENQPLLWRNLNKQMEMYYTGRIQPFKSDDIDYVDFVIESNIRNGDGSLSAQTGRLRVPASNMFELYESVISNRAVNALSVISRFKHANLSFTPTTDDADTAKFRANYFNDIFYQIISRMNPVWMYSEKLDTVVDGYSMFDPVSLADKMVLAPYSQLSPIAQQVLIKEQIFQQKDERWNSDRFHVLNTVRSDFSVIMLDSFPVGWVVGKDIYLMEPLRHAELFLKEKAEQREGHSFSPFIKSVPEAVTFTNIAVFKPNDYGAFNVQVEEGITSENFDSSYYTEQLGRALVNTGFKIKKMFEENISVQVVQGHWRLGDRHFNNSDGTTTLIIDIDSFRDPFLLEFVVRHELLPHSGAAGEVAALLNDVFAFQNLSNERQQQLLHILRNDNIDLQNFAGILEKSAQAIPADIINDIIAYVSDDQKYPKLSLELKGMNGDEVYSYLSHQFNDEFASQLESMDLNPLEVAKLTLHPDYNNLGLALGAIETLKENPAFPESARESVFSYLLENEFNVDAIAQAFYEMDKNDAEFGDLFLLFGPEIIPVLLKHANGDNNKLQRFGKFILTFGRSFGDTFKYSINPFVSDQYFEFVVETGSTNIQRFYNRDGGLYVENIYDHVDWYNVLPEQTEDMAVLCEEFFGKNIETAIGIIDHFMETYGTQSQTDASIKSDMDQLVGLVSKMIADYHKMKVARKYLDLNNIPLSKQEISIELNSQFISDLVGSPITLGLGMIQIADAEIKDAEKDERDIDYQDMISSLQQARDGLNRVRQMLIQYRIMKDYRISLLDDTHMVKFPSSMDLDVNTPIREQVFYPESALAEQIKSQMNSENDVYVVYFFGHETNSMRFISDVMGQLDTEQPVRIVVVSPQLDTDVVESLLTEFNLIQAASLIIGKDILAKSDNQTLSGKDVVSLIQNNIDNPPDNIIFMSDQTRVFSDLMREGLTVLPLPDIKQTPKPYSPGLGRKAIIDRAA